ncbi:hypothetical protein ACLOJK_003402 [Asimina triloba]
MVFAHANLHRISPSVLGKESDADHPFLFTSLQKSSTNAVENEICRVLESAAMTDSF